MNTLRIFRVALVGAALTLTLTGCGGDAKKLQAENEALRAELAELKARAEAEAQSTSTRDTELKRLQADARDAVRLRGEITQLRSGSKDSESLRAENQRLKAENQSLRGASATAAPAPTAPAAGEFPREAWSYAGYQTPEAALISAIYSMQQGNPKQYFDSLTTEEQLRMTKVWENKTPEEIAAKHVNDTSKITNIKVLNAQETAPGQMVLSVYIGGVDRAEKVNMQRVGNEWKFGGFIREPAKP